LSLDIEKLHDDNLLTFNKKSEHGSNQYIYEERSSKEKVMRSTLEPEREEMDFTLGNIENLNSISKRDNDDSKKTKKGSSERQKKKIEEKD
jgi:hypothetical protein